MDIRPHFSWIDWGIMAVCVVAIRLVSLSARKHMRGVADFLSANRTAGRYLLTIAGQMGGFAAISMIAVYQQYFKAGFTVTWWGFMTIPIGVIILLTGWVYYRFRETRAMTMAQFLEMRYNQRFRIFSGVIIWLCGILNFGIFPAVTARFFVYFCGLPTEFGLLGLTIPTFMPIMAIDLLLALTFVNMGGQISVMVTDCAQGIVAAFAFLIIVGVVLTKVHWADITLAAQMYAPENASMLNPFKTSQMKDYNIWFFLIGVFGSFYGASSWLGTQGFMTSGRSAHEQKMGGIISVWRSFPLTLMMIVLPMAAFAVLNLDKYAHIAGQATAMMNTISNESIMHENRVPLVLTYLLPVGIKGLLATVMLFFSFTCHDTYMHSWGSIFIQDVYKPMAHRVKERNGGKARLDATLLWVAQIVIGVLTALVVYRLMPGRLSLGSLTNILAVLGSPSLSVPPIVIGLLAAFGSGRAIRNVLADEDGTRQHVMLLRYSIIFVAFFAFSFSMLYNPNQDILMFFAITGTIWAGGSGAVIVGGLYWKKGTTAAAYTSLILGATVGVGGLVVTSYWERWFGKQFPINGQWIWMLGMLLCILAYAVVSHITCRGRYYNIEKMLHRGRYKVASDKVEVQAYPSIWLKICGITPEFSVYDRILAIALVVWNASWFLTFIGVTVYHLLVSPISTAWFMKFWKFYITLFFALSIPSTIWFTIGGVKDLKALFRDLKAAVRDHTDDGRVIHEPDEDYVPIDQPAPEVGEPQPEMDMESATDGGNVPKED